MTRSQIAANAKKSLLMFQHFVLSVDSRNGTADLLVGGQSMIPVAGDISVHNLNANAASLHVVHLVLHMLLQHQITGDIDAALA